jgi:hypothetical protein
MVFKRTTPITALDLDPSDIPDATASLKGGVKSSDAGLHPVGTQTRNLTTFFQSVGGTSKTELLTTNSPTFTSVATNLVSVWRRLADRGMKVMQTTITPFTTSTDSFTTTGNQTIATDRSSSVRLTINDWIRAGAHLNASTLAPWR